MGYYLVMLVFLVPGVPQADAEHTEINKFTSKTTCEKERTRQINAGALVLQDGKPRDLVCAHVDLAPKDLPL